MARPELPVSAHPRVARFLLALFARAVRELDWPGPRIRFPIVVAFGRVKDVNNLAHTVFLQAQTQPGGPQQLIASFMPMILIFVVMYLLLIRPQQTKAKKHKELLRQLKVGDRIVTNGGIHGTISGVQDKTLLIEVAEKIEIEVARGAIARLREKDEDAD